EVGGDDEQLVRGRAGDGDVVLAEGPLGQVADHEAGLHPQQHGAEQTSDAAEQLGAGIRLDGLGLVPGRCRQGTGQALEERSVGVQSPLGPGAAAHGEDMHDTAGRRRGQPRGLGDLELGHPPQLLIAHAHEGIDVVLGLALVGPGTAARSFVYASTAMVYGAWPNNPVPLTEDAPLRPNPGFAYAASRAEIERAALEWREADDRRRLAVLRPATVLADEDDRL